MLDGAIDPSISIEEQSLVQAVAFDQALKGDGTTFAKLADQYNGRKPDGTYFDNQNDANIIIDCLDWKDSKCIEAIRADVAKFVSAAPVFGPYVAYSGITCNLLNASLNRKQVLTDQNSAQIQRTATPVLIIGTTQDPATPYAWAKALVRYIKGSRLITFYGEGHTGYGRGLSCVDDAVDEFLIRGVNMYKALQCHS